MSQPRSRRRRVVVAAAIVIPALLAAGSAQAAVPTPPAGSTVVNVRVGGDRVGDSTVGPLAGVTLGLYADPSDTAVIDPSWAVCTSDVDGDCNFIAPSSAAGSRPWVRQISAPAGWFVNPSLRTGAASGSGSVDSPYQFQTGPLVVDTTVTSTANFMFSADMSDPTASSGIWQNSRVNPPLTETCGLDVALVLDLSRSVGSSLPSLKAAADGFIDSLVGTPSRVALFSFSRTSPSDGSTGNFPALQPVSTQAGADAVKAVYQPWELASGTNWDQGMFKVAQATERYEVVIVLTDGNPSRWGPPPAQGNGSTTHFADVENGIFSANAIKAKGTRVIALGVGRGVEGLTALNLAAISGQTAWDGTNTLAADYFQTTDYAQAGAELRTLVRDQCQNSLTVVKQEVPPQNRGEDVTGARAAGAGWAFAGSTTTAGVGGLPSTQTTTDDGTGSVVYDLTFPAGTATIPTTVAESQRVGWSLVTQGGQNAVCTNLDDDAPVPVVNGIGPAFSVGVPNGAAVSCTVYNRGPLASELAVRKRWSIDGTGYDEGAQPAGFTAALTLTGPSGAGASAQPWGVSRGGYQAGETAAIDETTTLPSLCRLDSRRVTAVNGAATDAALPHTLTLAEGANSATVTNTVTCSARLTLRKQVENDFGGTARATAWTLRADGVTDVSGRTGSAAVTDALVRPGSYRLSEHGGPAGYDASTWSCRAADGDRVAVRSGSVTLARGEDVTCTIVNRQVAPRLTLRKLADLSVVTAGRTLRYTLVVSDRSRVRAVGARLCDRLPGRVTLVSRGGGRLSAGQVCWRLAGIRPRGTTRRSIVVRVDRDVRGGTIVNRATVTIGRSRATRRVIRARKAVRVRAGAVRPSIGGGVTG